MRNLRVSLAGAVLAVAVLPVAALATSAKTDITGVVYNNGQPVAGAKVTVVCDNNARHDTTDSTGAYLVQFPAAQCPAGDKATVVASKNRKGGVNSATVDAATTKLNVNIINVDIPEFGILAGFAAVAGAGALFIANRRRELGQR